VRGVPGPGEDVAGVSPDKVRGSAVVVHDVNICAVRSGGEHSCAEAALAPGPPAVQEDESGAIGIEQQVIEVVFCAGEVGVRIGDIYHVCDGDYKVLSAGFRGRTSLFGQTSGTFASCFGFKVESEDA